MIVRRYLKLRESILGHWIPPDPLTITLRIKWGLHLSFTTLLITRGGSHKKETELLYSLSFAFVTTAIAQ